MTKQWQLVIKYGFDLIAALILALPVSLLILVLGVLVYLDSPGAIIFKQQRIGKNGKIFSLYKLRTMIPGDHIATTPRNADGSLAITEDSAGYTRTGKWLKRLSLDELPQIYNIIKGEMSFIGPRPDLPEHLQLYCGAESNKLLVRPGMTGLAQVMGRNSLPWKERLKLDSRYVKEYSLFLDLKILWYTIWRLISGQGVYQP